MENDEETEQHPLDELQEAIKKIPPSMKKGDKIIVERIAEAQALLEGNPSEENVQRWLKLMDWNDQASNPTPSEKRYQFFGFLLTILGIILLVIGPIFNRHDFVIISGGVMLAIGAALVFVGIIKRTKRIDNLPPPPE